MNRRRFLAYPVALATIAAALGLASQDSSKEPARGGLQALQRHLQKLQSKERALRKQLSSTRKQVRETRGDLRTIDGRLEVLEASLGQTTARLHAGREEQARLADELKVATHRLQETKDQVRMRLRWMYTHENTRVMSVLVRSRDASDFASRAVLLERIAKADRALFDDYARRQQEVEDKKARQDRLVVQVEELKRTQETQQGEMKSVRADKASLLGQLRVRESELERLVAQVDAEERALEASIAAYYRSAGKASGLKPFTGRFSRPVSGPMTSGFGMRMHPILRRRRMHNGIDFGAPHGAPILAAADGVVITATYTRGYGNTVILDHGGGVSTLYAHCSRVLVSGGQRVRRGQTIAAVGSTGLSTGPHLHFEVRLGGKPVNPLGKF